MQNELKDILSNSNKDIDNQQLMDYLSKRLSETGQHELEKAMAGDPFVNDAVEGLQQLKSEAEILQTVSQLNQSLKHQVNSSRKRREKRRWKDEPYLYFTIALLILLLLIGFVVVVKML